MCILDELYHEWHSPREKPRKEEHTAWGYNEDLWIRAEKVLDGELFEELKQSVMELIDMEACREFEEGFRLGAQLILDLQLTAAPTSTAL